MCWVWNLSLILQLLLAVENTDHARRWKLIRQNEILFFSKWTLYLFFEASIAKSLCERLLIILLNKMFEVRIGSSNCKLNKSGTVKKGFNFINWKNWSPTSGKERALNSLHRSYPPRPRAGPGENQTRQLVLRREGASVCSADLTNIDDI